MKEKTVRYGIICAFDKEISQILAALNPCDVKTYAMLSFNAGIIHGIEVVAVECGISKVNAAIAAQLLIDKFEVTNIVFVGVAGAIDERLDICDTVVASDIAYHDVYDTILTNHHPKMKTAFFIADEKMTAGILKANSHDSTVTSGRIVTGEAFITQDGRLEIVGRFNPACVDMETAAAAHVAYVNGIPFTAIRSMSDTPRECGEDNFDKYCAAASEKSAAVLMNYFKSLNF